MTSPHHILKKAQRDQFRLVGTGLFAQVVRVVDTKIALKIYDGPARADEVERRIYERLGSHPFILECYGEGDSAAGRGLVLQYMSAGTLEQNLDLKKFHVERERWPDQAVEAVRYIHSKHVFHYDIGVENFLIQDDGSLALSDFSGSSIDGSENIAAPSVRYAKPASLEERRSPNV